MQTPLARVCASLADRGLRYRQSGNVLSAQCPAHEDQHPSLSVSEGDDGRVLVFCHAGCAFEDVLAALGLTGSDAFVREERRSVRRRPPASPPAPDTRDAEGLWEQMALTDATGMCYLEGRGLLANPLPSDVVRFNASGTGNGFVDLAAERGFRIAFAVRNPQGQIASLSFRHAGNGAEWNGIHLTKLSLKGHSTTGVAIVRPEVMFLTRSDPEFLRDEVILCEGGTDWLAATITNDLAAIEHQVPPAWVIGCIGASNAESVVKAFAPALAGRVVRLWFDGDDAGEKAAEAAEGAAVEVGARRVVRFVPPKKDIAREALGWMS